MDISYKGLMMEWIKLSDEIPEDFKNVLVYLHEDESIWSAYFNRESLKFQTYYYEDKIGEDIPTEKITHWMPFPDKPKKDK